MLKKITSLLLTVCIFLCLSACGKNETGGNADDIHDDIQTDISQNTDDNDLSSTGNVVSLMEISSTGQIPYDKFDNISSEGYKLYSELNYMNYFDTELFPFSHKKLYGYADANGNVVISEKYDDATFFSENKAFVKQNDEWKVIDTKGNELLTLPNGYDASNSYFREGFAIISEAFVMNGTKNELNVLVLKNDMTYNEIQIFEELTYVDFKVVSTPEFVGFLIYSCYVPERKFTLYDISGKEIWTVTQEKEQNIDKFIIKNGYINVLNENGKWGLLDINKGEMVIDYQYDFIGGYSDGVCVINQYDKWGCIDINGNVVINPSFDYIGSFTNGKALAKTIDGEWVLIDKSGNILSQYDISRKKSYYNMGEFSQESGIATIFCDNSPETEYETPIVIITNDGQVLLSENTCRGLYVSNNYIFINERMYKINR